MTGGEYTLYRLIYLGPFILLHIRTEQYGPLKALEPRGTSDINIHLSQGQLVLAFKRIYRTIYFPISFTIGCDLYAGFIQDIGVMHLRSFEGFIYDFNVYQGNFEVNNFVDEIGCEQIRNKRKLLKIGSMDDFVGSIRKDYKIGLMIRKEISNLMCHQKCANPTNSGKGVMGNKVANCLTTYSRYLTIQNCHIHCHRIPQEVDLVDLCLNCIVYQWNCPLVKHMAGHFQQEDQSFHASRLVQKLIDQKDAIKKNTSTVLNWRNFDFGESSLVRNPCLNLLTFITEFVCNG